MEKTGPSTDARLYDEHASCARVMGLIKELPQNDGKSGNDCFSMAGCLRHLLKGESNIVLHGPTPSGKTVTMLVGIVERVQMHVSAHARSLFSRPSPKALVIVPSDYLCRKTADLARFLIRGASARNGQAPTVTVLPIDGETLDLEDGFKDDADIVVTTLAMLARIHHLSSIDWSETLILGLDDVECVMGNRIFEGLISTGRLFDTCKNRVQVIATGRFVDVERLRKMNRERRCTCTAEISCSSSKFTSRFLNIPHFVHCIDSPQVVVRAGKAAELVRNALKEAEGRKKPSPFVTTIWATWARATMAAKILRNTLPHWDIEVVHSLDEDVTQSEVKLSCREFAAADDKGFDTYEVLHSKSVDVESKAAHPSLIIHADLVRDTSEMSSWHTWFINTSRIGGNGKNVECHTFFDPRRQLDVIVAANLRDMLRHKNYRYPIPFGLSFLRNGAVYDMKGSKETRGDDIDGDHAQDDEEEDGFVMV